MTVDYKLLRFNMDRNHWQPIGRTSNQVILYHPPSNVLSIRQYQLDPVAITSIPGTPAAASRVTSHTNLPVLARRSDNNGPQGEVSLRRRESSAVTSRGNAVEPDSAIPPSGLCPYCYRPMSKASHRLDSPDGYESDLHTPSAPTLNRTSTAHVFPIFSDESEVEDRSVAYDADDRQVEWSYEQHNNEITEVNNPDLLHVRPYFQILAQSVDGSRHSTPVGEGTPERMSRHDRSSPDNDARPARSIEGYYSRFFIEERRLGRGAEGTVYLCQHVLDGNYLGHYAIKKVAVGNSKPYLFKILQEVRLLEQLRHPNIIPVLMSYANAGNLDDFIKSRCSTAGEDLSIHPIEPDEEIPPEELKRRIRERRKSARSISEAGNKAEFSSIYAAEQARRKKSDARAVMLLGTGEIASLFGDVVNGLHYLHSNGILHLDLKCSNVLLHNREGELIPRAMISDFGTSEEMLHRNRDRTGHTGTMEYMAPETISPDPTGHWREWDTKADIWSLGLILHKLLFFRLPYAETESYEELGAMIHEYPGFKATAEIKTAFTKRGLPLGLLTLLEDLTNVVPSKRPSMQKVVQRSTTLYTQASAQSASANGQQGALVPVAHFLPILRNPWRASKDGREMGDPKLQATATHRPRRVGLEGVMSSLRAIPRAKYLSGALSLFKLCTLLPPMRSDLPPPFILYTLILFIIVDLQADNLVLSYILTACHAAALLWKRSR
ncbi:hypothetical protein QFC22_004825 [Naganishia vaughanmartiniae]|uniref:Uncharacterized protein n=1 Tax=Naganishia vaughanmartiniae TaxID=1424756 RepID=A0ACC2WZ54_9TREE|nr:hypothetical protein QFC22_004825 [Naganishia vaughanmartiniae]